MYFKATDGKIKDQSEFKTLCLLSKSLQAIHAGEGVEKREPSYTAGVITKISHLSKGAPHLQVTGLNS